MFVAKWLTNQISTEDRFPVRENMYLLFNSDIVNLLMGGETEGVILLFLQCGVL